MQLKAYGTYYHFFAWIGNKECLHLHYCIASGCELCDDFCYHIKRYNFNKANVHMKKKEAVCQCRRCKRHRFDI